MKLYGVRNDLPTLPPKPQRSNARGGIGMRESTERPTVAAEVSTPDANTHGQTGTADERARSLVPANAEAVAKQVGQSEQIATVEPSVDTGLVASTDTNMGMSS